MNLDRRQADELAEIHFPWATARERMVLAVLLRADRLGGATTEQVAFHVLGARDWHAQEAARMSISRMTRGARYRAPIPIAASYERMGNAHNRGRYRLNWAALETSGRERRAG